MDNHHAPAVPRTEPPLEVLPDHATMLAQVYLETKGISKQIHDINGHLAVIKEDQNAAAESAARIDTYQGDLRQALVRFVNRLEDVYVRQNQIFDRFEKIEAWQALHGDTRATHENSSPAAPEVEQ